MHWKQQKQTDHQVQERFFKKYRENLVKPNDYMQALWEGGLDSNLRKKIEF